MEGGRCENPAVVVGLTPTALGLVRSVAPYCSQVIALESNMDEPGIGTRMCKVRMVPSLQDHAALLDQLVALAATMPARPVLFLTTDEHVLWAAGPARAVLEAHYHLLLPPAPVCEDLMFKERFLALAAREGWPVPKGGFLPVDGLTDAIRREGLRFPVILKPSIKTSAWERRGLSKAYIVQTPDEAQAVVRLAQGAVDHLLAQEYLEGADDQVNFCLYLAVPGLEPLAFSGRKLLQWPPLRGSTAVCEPVDAPELETFTREMFGRLGVQGFASLEVKYGADGKFVIIEPTIGRVDLQSPVAALNGMNMPLVAYLGALGRPEEARPFAQRIRRDVLWVNESSVWNLVRSHAIGPAALWNLAVRNKGFALSSWADPGVLRSFAQSKLESGTRRAWSWLRTSPVPV